MSDIRLALFCDESHPSGKRLKAVLQQRVGDNFQLFRTVQALDRGFRRPGHAAEILVLCPCTGADLLGLMGIRHLLINARIVLILPDRSGDIIARGHTLYPRYVSYSDGDFSDVAAVLNKMLQKEETGAAAPSAHFH